MNKVLKKEWIKFAIATVLYLIWVIWMGNLWLLIGELLIIDIYLTRFFPYGFWKKSSNQLFKKTMEWVDAIAFALVAVYIINLFTFQNYQIPSPSLEKSLMVGDYLLVSKMSYGPRVPNTPLSFPLAQHTLPILNCKSYIEYPQWDYKRLKGFGSIQRNDIVVFNFPAGDTVLLKAQQSDYYTLCEVYGKERVNRDVASFGEKIYRPVDRRENYVKRCIGLPGDSLQIKDNIVFINGEKMETPLHAQFNYYVETNGKHFTEKEFRELHVSVDDRNIISSAQNPVYQLPLTQQALEKVKSYKFVTRIMIEPQNEPNLTYPLGYGKGWTMNNYGTIWIPCKGSTITLNEDNLPIYERVIRNYEKNELKTENGKIFINGRETTTYTFQMNYYWMMGDNRHNSADSRCWGFVPEDHIVGKPLFVWLSLDKDRGWFDGKIRFNRLFHSVESLSKN